MLVPSGLAQDLRARAEALPGAPADDDPQDWSPESARRILHDLLVHQIELEMQNQELRQAQEALERSRHQFWTLFEKAPVGYVVMNGDGMLEEINGTFARLLGFEPHQVKGRPFQDLLIDSDRPVFLARFRAIQKHPEGKDMEFGLQRSDGTHLEVRLEGARVEMPGLRPDSPHAERLLLIVHDMTERRALEREVARAQKTESLGSLAGGVAHDMNNVLAAILSLASLHHSLAPAGSSLARAMETITRASVRGRTLVQGLLDFSRRGLARTETLDLNVLLQEYVALLERTTLSRIRLVTDLAEGLRPLQGDPSALGHALMNLCVNAVDAMPGGGALTLRTFNEGVAPVGLEIIDTGCGMPPHVLVQAFDPFFTTKADGQGTGTGLGVSIAYGCLKAHGGQVELRSRPGEGTRALILLPACQAAGQPREDNGGRTERGRSMALLVVDDDELVQASLGDLLSMVGHRPTIAGGGEEALRLLEKGHDFDVVLLDLNMPGLGGYGSLPGLRSLRPMLPVFLVTGRVDQRALDLVQQFDGVSLLPKPFTLEELQARLAAVDRDHGPQGHPVEASHPLPSG